MATNDDLIRALQIAAEHLLGRNLTTQELSALLDRFNKTPGRPVEKALGALEGLGGRTSRELAKTASDNSDRIINDLIQVANSWNPKP
ncbi:hypothetical protein [Geothrix mesophila]|uniref:hypothetical protein n=1 Tax=Geothrix mesophila TaxID=2922723 RepID=UPI001FAD64BF|nr:hypothetical protein [Geothrix sp. SG198]